MGVQYSRRIGTAMLVGVAGLALSACAASGVAGRADHPAVLSSAIKAGGCSGPTVTATGSGTISVAPDLLSVVLGVHTAASSAQAALVDNNAKARAVIATLERAGVAKSDLQTTGLFIEPTYSHPKGAPSKIDGYQVDDTVTAQVHQLSSAGTLIDRAAGQVGNAVRLEGISFSLEHANSAEAAAHIRAVDAGMAEAQAMATAAKTTLGTLCSVSDVNNGQDVQGFAASAAASSAGAGSVPVESGSEQVSAQVKVVYALAG